jgi:DNA-binding CsgD family transcriptional regulator
MKADLLSILEAAYMPSAGEDAWVQSILPLVEPFLDRGLGVFGFGYSYESGRFARRRVHGLGDQAGERSELMEAGLDRVPRRPDGQVAEPGLGRFYPSVPTFSWASHISPDHARLLASTGAIAKDVLGIVGGDPSGQGVVFCAWSKSQGRELPGRTQAIGQRLASHIAHGYRLTQSPQGRIEAVLEGNGKVRHLEPSLTVAHGQVLSQAAQEMDQARGRLRRVDPDRALGLWRGLINGRWTLVDHFDHDGRRYLMAKRNAPALRPWHSLTEREGQAAAYAAHGQPNKVIAYELGVPLSTVASDLSRARKKIGVGSRLELIAAYRRAHPETAPQ